MIYYTINYKIIIKGYTLPKKEFKIYSIQYFKSFLSKFNTIYLKMQFWKNKKFEVKISKKPSINI